METRKPKWNDKLDAWTMDFKGRFEPQLPLPLPPPQLRNGLNPRTTILLGRVKLPSKKNFILVDHNEDEERSLLMFGKVTKNRFTLDFREPFTPTQALFVALTAFASKLAVT